MFIFRNFAEIFEIVDTIKEIKGAQKPVLKNIIDSYSVIANNIDGIIEETGYRSVFIAKKLRMPKTTFYHKKRTKTFTFEEVAQIVGMLDDDEAMENSYLLELAKSEMVEDDDEEDGTGDELIAMLRR